MSGYRARRITANATPVTRNRRGSSVSFGRERSVVSEDADDRADGQTRVGLQRDIARAGARALS